MFRPRWICRQCLWRLRARPQELPTVCASLSRTGLQVRRQSNVAASTAHKDGDIYLTQSLLRRAHQLSSEHDHLEKQLLESFDTKTAARAGHLRPISEALKEYESAVENLTELRQLSLDPSSELASLAAEDIPQTISTILTSSNALTTALIPRHPFASYPAILEIRPGAGGGEAALFANDLYKMYSAFCTLQRWRTTVLSLQTQNEVGGEGVTEVVFSVDSPDSYDLLRHEAGVHRVQRVPATENKGRTHTSTASVMVLPSFGDDSSDIEAGSNSDPLAQLDPKDIRVDIMRASGAGGQHVNKTESAVRMTHIPTGIIVSMQDTRSQHKNRERALTILRVKVAEKRRKEREDEVLSMRRGVVKIGAGRSDKIRTYNYTQNRITDHRPGESMHDLPAFMRGEGLEGMIEKIKEWDVKREVEVMLAMQEAEEEEDAKKKNAKT